MIYEFTRSEKLLGKEAMGILKNSAIAVFGIGGVGSYTAEALCRCGVGHLTFVDNDVVSVTNINRQIIALHSTIGKHKTEVMKERALDINPSAKIETFNCFFNEETCEQFDFEKYDYVVDAIDTVKSKLLLIELAGRARTKIISSMGTGNKLDPSQLEITDIYKTEVCPLARAVRKEAKQRKIKKLKVLFSREVPVKISENLDDTEDLKNGYPAPASISFVPSVAGLMIAGEVVRDLIK